MKALLGTKLGMSQVFDEEGRVVPVTLLEAGPCVVTQVRTPERDGYAAVQIGFGAVKASRVRKPQAGHFAKAGVEPSRHLVEVRAEDAALEVGAVLKADVFSAGDSVDVIGVSKGKGFSGAMKRHGFHGLRDSHGTERKHRSTGSIGAGTTPGRVWKGKKGPGRMGNTRTTILNLRVVEADPERNLLVIRGAVPGPNGGLVMVRTSVKGSA